MLINVHLHIAAGQDVHEWHERQALGEADVNIVCGDWDKCEEAMRTFPGHVMALGMLSYEDDQPELIDQCHDRGFSGLKIIELRRAYDDPAYFPIYEKAVEYGMPILFHTGHIRLDPRQRRNVISRPKMDARCLDGIARAFPELYLIGAHLGNPCYEEACSLALKHPRVYFDLTGGTVRMLPYSRWRQLLMTGAEENLRSLEETLNLRVVNKFVFGTDGQTVPVLREFHENLSRAFDFPEETRELIRWRNVARMFGIEKELEARGE